MRILLTGSTGYIGRRLLPVLVTHGHHIICAVRDPRRFDYEDFDESLLQRIEVIKADLSDAASLEQLPKDIDAAYYFVHGMSNSYTDFSTLEDRMVENFSAYIATTSAQQIIYLGGISNAPELSRHLRSRLHTEEVLRQSGKPLTVLRAAIIIGSGSASFEIIRDLVEKLPVMVAPKWIKTRCQPIGIRNVIAYLEGVLLKEACYHQVFDIGGEEILTYKEMMLGFAAARKLRRWIFSVPVLSPRLSARWLYFVTSTSFNLARSLVESMRNDVVCQDNRIREIVPIQLLSYRESLDAAFQRIAQNEVVSSWKDTINGPIEANFLDFIKVPTHGCFKDIRRYTFQRPSDEVLDNIFAIGGRRGWYYGTWMWYIRGFMDKLMGGVGLRRGRRSPKDLKAGDALDFWRVILADRKGRRLLLYAEMKLPGEAWLEFHIKPLASGGFELSQQATFRPAGLAGRLYWYLVLPFHGFIFPGMARNIIQYQEKVVLPVEQVS